MKFFFQMAQKKDNVPYAVRDIEDTVGMKGLQISTVSVPKKQGKQLAVVSKYDAIEDCPSPEEDFSEWLKYQKSNWRKIRKIIKEDKKVIPQSVSSKHQGIVSFIRNMDDVVLKSNWHIMQICETFEPGVMKIWALTESG